MNKKHYVNFVIRSVEKSKTLPSVLKYSGNYQFFIVCYLLPLRHAKHRNKFYKDFHAKYKKELFSEDTIMFII